MMPGKYSHSVVLADFSSRGVICLPDEQHVKYVSSSPQQQGSPASQLRMRGTRSAQAVYRPASTSTEGWDALTSGLPHPSLNTNATTSRTRVNVPIGVYEAEARPKRYSQVYEQLPRSTPAVNVISQSEPKTAYERQQRQYVAQADRSVASPTQLKSTVQAKRASAYLSPSETLAYPAFRELTSNSCLTEEASASRQRRHSTMPRSGGTSSSETLAASSARPITAAPRESRAAEAQPSSDQNSVEAQSSIHVGATFSSNGRLTPEIWRCSTPAERGRLTPEIWRCVTTPEYETRRAKQEQLLKDQARKEQQRNGSVNAKRSNSNVSRMSRHTQIWDPQSSVLEEPDFDGFTDQEESPAGYFDVPRRAPVHSKNSSHDLTLIIQRPETRDGPVGRDQSSNGASILSSHAPSIRTMDRSTPSTATASSTIASSQDRRSNSSVSSVSIPSGYVPSNKNIASSRKDVRASVETSWRLPEIQEDHGFSPSIFEDHQGSNDFLKLDTPDAERSIGQVSSGKDVTFNDAASELSAALPPPITRFRDEEDEFNANMTKLFGEGSDYAIGNRGSQTIGRSSRKKEKKSFFSFLRSKSQPPRK